MQHNDLTFFTNEPNRNLYERFSSILKSKTQYFDILVGYFRTSGFFRLADAMQGVDKIRVLVGLNVDSRTVEFIKQANEEIRVEHLSHKETKEAFETVLENEFIYSEDSYDLEKGVRLFIDWLKTGKLEMRMYTESPLHAKVYIMRKNMKLVPDTFGSVITGSSNFSEAGLKNNLEFNVELKDSRDVDFALEKFMELWKKSVDIKENYIETIENRTWLKDDITPYELYLKTIYEFFNEEINADKIALLDELLPDGYMRLQYQLDAVVDAEKKLEAFGGVFVSDVVGLGKTYICSMLAKKLKKGKKLIICPPVLVDYWKSVLLEFDVAARVESLGKLDKLIEEGHEDYKYVFIDEAHRFWNSNTEGFTLLHQICKGKKVVLVSATPINNYSSDIENQIYLFQSKHNSILPNIKNLEGFFATLNGAIKKLKSGTPEYRERLKLNSEIIRDSILRHIMIRRTRKEIMEFYKEDLEKQGLTFPNLGTPEKVIYSFDANTDEVFKETMHIIKNLDYARYSPLLYLRDNSKYSTLLVAQKNMSGFMKAILVKRLESSFYAFKMTLNRFIDSYQRFIGMCDTGDVYISKKVNVYDLLDNGDDEKLIGLVEDETVQYFKFADFSDEFMPSLQRDLALLKRLKSHWSEIILDPKLTEFKKELRNNCILQNKIIIFTESKETAFYLGNELKVIYGDRCVVFSDDSSVRLKSEIEYSFNPKYKKENKDNYDVLITTDVLAEGINLHRSNVVINYDLPWNPTRIMQRVGRINRVGTEFDKIHVFNFFPTSQTDKHLPMKDRIIEKLQMFHDTLGEDFKYLSDDEKVDSYKLYEELTGSLDDEDSGTSPELAYLAVIRQVRDNDSLLFNKIKRLPIKARTGKLSDLVQGNSTITFLKQGYLKMFFKTENNKTEQLAFINAISYIKSKIDDKKINIDFDHFKHLENNKEAFDNKLSEEDAIILGKVTVTGNDAKMIRRLKWIAKCQSFTDHQDQKIIKLMSLWENGEIPQVLTKQILKDINEIDDPMQAYFEIYDRVPDIYFIDQKINDNKNTVVKQVVLSCYMKNGG